MIVRFTSIICATFLGFVTTSAISSVLRVMSLLPYFIPCSKHTMFINISGWDRVMPYLEQNLKRTEFMMFFRKLASQNNLDYCSKIEAELSNKQVENGNIFSEEVVHQLMLCFRHATPAVTPREVICALRLCNLNLHADTLSRIIALEWRDEQKSGNTSTSTHVRGELES